MVPGEYSVEAAFKIQSTRQAPAVRASPVKTTFTVAPGAKLLLEPAVERAGKDRGKDARPALR